MNIRTDRTNATGGRARRFRAGLVMIAAVAALAGPACAPQTPPAGGGGVAVDFGPLTIPLPPFEIRPPATTIPVLGLCNVGFQPPGIRITNATVTIPGIRIDPSNPIITVPNVRVNIPGLRAPVASLNLQCGPIVVPVTVEVILPSAVSVQAVTLNLAARTITLTSPSLTLNGAGLGVLGLDLVVPLPPIVAIPLPSAAIAF